MSLSAEQFASVVGSVERPSVPHHEKRRAPRVVYRARVQIMLGGGKQVMTTVRDISSRGVGLMHGEPLEAGSQFVLQLPRGKQTPAALLCTVAYCRQQHASMFVIGAEFTCVLNCAVAAAPAAAGSARDEAESKELERIRKSILS
ncbi:MAG: hypothetical protein JWO31_2303 [Phycisphaerales bacterium]|nr:hypothetical protein [Phycisphaerales bacterium]